MRKAPLRSGYVCLRAAIIGQDVHGKGRQGALTCGHTTPNIATKGGAQPILYDRAWFCAASPWIAACRSLQWYLRSACSFEALRFVRATSAVACRAHISATRAPPDSAKALKRVFDSTVRTISDVMAVSHRLEKATSVAACHARVSATSAPPDSAKALKR